MKSLEGKSSSYVSGDGTNIWKVQEKYTTIRDKILGKNLAHARIESILMVVRRRRRFELEKAGSFVTKASLHVLSSSYLQKYWQVAPVTEYHRLLRSL